MRCARNSRVKDDTQDLSGCKEEVLSFPETGKKAEGAGLHGGGGRAGGKIRSLVLHMLSLRCVSDTQVELASK